MVWAKFDDQTLNHPKFHGLSDSTKLLWFRSILYCTRYLTDGALDQRALSFLGAKENQVRSLVQAGLFDKSDEGQIAVHDFLDYQPSREQVLREREQVKQRVANFRSRKEEKRAESEDESRRYTGVSNAEVTSAVTPNVTRTYAVGNAAPDPARPDPTRPEKKSQPAAASVAREAPPPPTDPPPATPARAAEPAAKPPPEAPRATGGSGGDLESQLVGLLENDKHLASLHADVATLVERVAYAADAKRPAHVLAAVRKALDVAAASSWGLTPTVKTVLAYASKASEADLPSSGGKAGKAAALESKPARWTVLQSGSEEHRNKIADHFDFRRSCGWDVGKPWPLPEMVAAGWREGMPWLPDPMPLAKTSPDPTSGPANGNVEGKRRPKAGGEA